MNYMPIKNLFNKLINIQFLGLLKIGHSEFSTSQFENLINNNIEWKNFISYKKGQICSYKNTDGSSFYCALVDNEDKQPINNIDCWQKINTFVYGIKQKNLIFKIPFVNHQCHFYIQFSENISFESEENNIISYNTKDYSYLFFISNSNSGDILQFSGDLTNSNSYEILIFNIASVNQNYKYFRYRWKFIDDSDVETYSKYFFGNINSTLQVFSQQSDNFLIVDYHDKNILGNGTADSPLMLNKDLNIDSINNNDQLKISATNFITLQSLDIKYNNSSLNEENGLLQLKNGKIPNDLINASQLINDIIPNKTDVNTKYYGNPLTIKVKSQKTVQNDQSTILLYQNQNVNEEQQAKTDIQNMAIGYEKLRIIQNENSVNINVNSVDFNGGISFYASSADNNNLINSIFQISFELSYSDVSSLSDYKSVFKHYLYNQQLCYFQINNRMFKFWQGNNCLFADLISNYVYDYEYLKFVFMYSQSKLNVYCNNEQIGDFYLNDVIYINGLNNNYFSFGTYGLLNPNKQGYYGGWNYLKCDLMVKESQKDKQIGQWYNDIVEPNEILVDYTMYDGSKQVDLFGKAELFGKIGTKPYCFPYPDLTYTLPQATNQKLGGVKIGSGLKISPNGVLSVVSMGLQSDALANYVANGSINICSSSPTADFKIYSGQFDQNGIFDGGFLLLRGKQSDSIVLASNAQKLEDEIIAVDTGLVIKNNKIEIKNNESLVTVYNSGAIQITATDIKFNGSSLNKGDGLVKLESGKIPNTCLNLKNQDDNLVIGNRITVKINTTTSKQYSSIKEGNGVELVTDSSDSNCVVINASQIGVRRDDISIPPNKEISLLDKENGYYKEDVDKYIFIVKNATLGSFIIKDYNEMIIYPSMKQAGHDVQVDLTQWIQNDLFKDGGEYYYVVFVRGEKGNDGQLTEQQALKLILTYLY